MAVINPQSIPMAGAVVTFVAASVGGDSFSNSGYVRVRAINASGGTLRINVEGQGVDNFGLSGNFTDMEVSLAAGEEKTFGPFPPARFNDTNGRVQLTYPDGVGSLTVAVVNG